MINFWRRRHTHVRIGERTFDLLCLTAAFVLAVHAAHLPILLIGSLFVALGLRWWQRKYRPGRVPAWLKVPMLVILVGAVVLDYGNLFGREPGSALATGLLVLKLTESEAPRDARVAAAFACFLLMAALLFGQSMVATFVVALGSLPALTTWRSLEPTQASPGLPRQLLPAFGLLAASLPLALTAFVLVPRLSTPLWGTSNQQTAKTGLSDHMSPSDFTELLTDDSAAMRVSFDGPPPEQGQRYFRAFVMWDYDGKDWQRIDRPPTTIPIEALTTISYHISLEPTHQHVLPTLDVPLRAPAEAQPRADGEVFADKPVDDVRDYALSSAVRYRLEPSLDIATRMRALQLPDGFDPRTRALAAQWRQVYGHNDGHIVQAALNIFHDGGFSYTLLPAPLGRDAIDDFLFNTREGFCEHYASAFTVLMRAAGIPARVVTGFQGGFWNKLGQYLLVRNADAHAWSEVWLEGRGWVRVDPTAAVRPQRITQGAASAAGGQLPWYQSGVLESMRNQWDIVNRWWNLSVIGFDALRQRGLLTPFGIRDVDAGMLTRLLAISVAVFGTAGLAWALWRRPESDPALAALRALERKLAHAGVERKRSEGPQHFLRRAMRALPGQRVELDYLMRCYIELRYATLEPSPESLRAFRQAVRNFQPRRVVKEPA
jgi:transglutaminase-like putative cysteine protease